MSGTIDFIIVLKVLACFLITNSHCRDIYPWYFLAIGGGFGNSIFFAVSGYCLAVIGQEFGAWYRKRCKRLIPALALAICMDLVFVEGVFDIIGLQHSGILWVERGVLKKLSEATLEIYLVQITFKRFVVGFAFPVNFVLFLCLAFVGGLAFHEVIHFLDLSLHVEPSNT